MSEKFFESQQPDEEVILVVRRHFLAILPSIFTAGLIYFLGFMAIIFFPIFVPALTTGFAYNIFVLILSLVFLFNTVFIFNNWILHYLHVAILTSEHFVEIAQGGLFSRKISEMTLDKVQDVSSWQKGIFNTLLDIGTVEVQTAGELPNFILAYIPDPNSTAQKIMEIEEVYCKKFGIRTDGLTSRASSNNYMLNQQETQPEQQSQVQPQTQPQSQPIQTEELPPVIEYPGEQ